MGRGIYAVTFEDGSQTHAHASGIMWCEADMSNGHCWSSDFGRTFSRDEVALLDSPTLRIELGWGNWDDITAFKSAARARATEIPQFTPRHHAVRFVDGWENDPEYYGHTVYRTPEEKAVLDKIQTAERAERKSAIENYCTLRRLETAEQWLDYFGNRQIFASTRPWESDSFQAVDSAELCKKIVAQKWVAYSKTGEIPHGHVSFNVFGAPTLRF